MEFVGGFYAVTYSSNCAATNQNTKGILDGCYRPTVARVLLCRCYGVLGGCYVATNTFWVAAIQLLGCYVVATEFWVVATVGSY